MRAEHTGFAVDPAVAARQPAPRAGLLICTLLVFAACPVSAADTAGDIQALELAVSDHPRQAVKLGEERMRATRAQRDKAFQLQTWRLLAMAHDEIEDNASLRKDTEHGLALARELDDTEAICQFLGFDAFLATNDGSYGRAATLYIEAIDYAEKNLYPRCRAKLVLGKADMLLQLGYVSDALSLAQQAYAYFEAQKDKLSMVSALTTMAGADIGDPGDPKSRNNSVNYYQRALALLDPRTNRFELATTYHNLGVAYARIKEYGKARDYLEKSMVIARELGDPVSEAFLYYRLGLLARDEGRNAQALADFDRAFPVLEKTDNVRMQFLVQVARTRALAQLGRKRDSLDALAIAQAFALKLKSPRTDIAYYTASAEIYAKFGDYQKAYQEVNELRAAETHRAELANSALTNELQTRFDARQKDAENNLLRAQAQGSEARRLALVLALILSLMLLGGLGFILMRNMRKSQRLANLAMRDDLTDLPNRRSILEFAQMQFRRRRASDEDVCVALIDIDHFKTINDDFGHDRGDAVLVAFADTCQQQLRSNDCIGRFGGEEFLLVMPGSGAAQIPGLFERLRSAVKRIRVQGVPASRLLTFSMGAAVLDPKLDTLDTLIKRADEALYRAKQSGRDRVEMSEASVARTEKASDLPVRKTAWVSLPEHQALLKYEAILNNASVGIAFTRERVFQHANPAFEDMFGWPRGGMVGQPGIAVWGSQQEYEEMGRAVGPFLSQGKSIALERKMMRRNGELFWCRIQARPVDLADPGQGGTIWILEDETERRSALERLQQLNEELERRVRARTDELMAANTRLTTEVHERQHAQDRASHLALHDVLTGLPNRRLLLDRLALALAQARREGWSVALMVIDLDRFKTINDSLGHAAGDEVLREMARRLREGLRDSDTTARVGGDEFVVLLPHVPSPEAVPAMATKIMTELGEPWHIGGQELRVTSSIGISIFPSDGDDAHELLGHAAAAMHHAKETGRRSYQFYAANLGESARTRLRLENDLHHAQADGQLLLYLQPRIELAHGTVCGYEALLRWNHPLDGIIEPNQFIPIAEDNGLIVPIGGWVIGEACGLIRRWRDAGLPVHPISVNLSVRQLFDTAFPEKVARALTAAGVEPALLEMEITESTLMENTEETISTFAALRALGVKLSIDDFGTGFSSLAYLKRFHVHNLKIDQSFVRDIGRDPDDDAIVLAIVTLAHSLQLRVIAEGVETDAQRQFLADCGCAEAQGFLFGRPRPANELDAPDVIKGTSDQVLREPRF
jgi:diguanylate cyclase (GGDEF)-like protein/PAS domain S-box-containing protein